MFKFCWELDDSKESAPSTSYHMRWWDLRGHMCRALRGGVGCDGGVLNGNTHHLACPERAVPGKEWPICPINIYLTCGHSRGGLQGDAHTLSEPRLFRPTPSSSHQGQVGPAHTPPDSPRRNINLSVLKNNNDANNLGWKKGKRIHWVEQDLLLL